MDTDHLWTISLNDRSAISLEFPQQAPWDALQQRVEEIQQRIEEIIGPLVDRRSVKDRRRVKRGPQGRRCTD